MSIEAFTWVMGIVFGWALHATLVHGVGDEPWPSVSSFGTRPTVDGD